MLDINKYTELVKKYRRDLHKIPEIGFDLFKTFAYVKAELEKLEIEYEVVAKTGIIGYLKGEDKEAIAFRADMDALNVFEETNVDFNSTHEGKMHACGHDGHMAMLLAYANFLVEKRNELKKSVVLIFQPAEEGPGGAVEIIKAGVFKKYNIKKIFGIHLYPEIEEGIYGLRKGPMLSQNAEFDCEVIGKSAHGALPHLGVDAILAASHLISSYQSIISRTVNPLSTNVITIGTIKGGEARNIIAKKVNFSGTLRSFSEEDYKFIKNKINALNKATETGFDVEVKMNMIDYYKTVDNDEELVDNTISNLKEDDYLIIDPIMASEDFSFYQREVPGLFVMLGTRNKKLDYIYPLHHACFNFREEVLVKGVELYILQAKIHNIL
ncbi:MAG: M20 family metallopeptidase [Bacilli bacterium]|nr:M20 family metallopeptidase [Bacilli bacterium]